MSVLTVGQTIGGRYVVEREIGHGGMQEVYFCHDRILMRSVALKVPQNERVARRFHESARISALVNHPNVAKTLDYFEEGGKQYLVEEYVAGADLKDVASRFKRLDPHATMHVFHYLSRGLAASHHVGVVHRDLKPSNVVIGGGIFIESVKITDFGIARMAEAEIDEAVQGGDETTKSSQTAMGALAYLAPEVIRGPSTPGMPADVWAIGAIAWELLSGKPPFGRGLKATAALFDGSTPSLGASVTGNLQFGRLAEEIKEIIMRCLTRDPAGRPTSDELCRLCDEVSYLRPVRETGVVKGYPVSTFGFIRDGRLDEVFFHERCVVGPRPLPGDEVLYGRFPGLPRDRAIPVLKVLPENRGSE